jgi:tetratricopeptide (TPR) repeat protein
MRQLLQILGRGIEVEAADLIRQWLRQAAETLRESDPAQAKLLDKIIDVPSRKNPANLQQHLDEYRRAYPRSYYADLAAAAVSLDDNRLIDAFELLNSVYSRCPRNVTALYALGHCCERSGREAEAIAFYQDCLKFKNYLQTPRQRLAAIYFKNGQIERTIREYEMLREEYPDDLTTALTLGYLYIAANRFRRAGETFSTAILIQPDYFCPDTDPIDSLIESGDFEEALRQIEDALTEFPDRPDLLLRRGNVLAELEQHEEALEQYNLAVTACPDFLEANIKLGSHYLRLGRHDCAAAQLTRCIYVNDRVVDAYIGLATAQKLAGNTSDALTSLSLASAVETNSPILFAEAIRLRYATPGQVRLQSQSRSDSARDNMQSIIDALNAHNRMLKAHPHSSEVHYRLGCLFMSVGRLSQAIELFSRAIELNPTLSPARNKLAVCLYETDEKAFALEQLSLPACLNNETLKLYYRVALLYCDKIKFASSVLNLEQWLRETLTSDDASLNISFVLQNLGLIDPAGATCEYFAQPADTALEQ